MGIWYDAGLLVAGNIRLRKVMQYYACYQHEGPLINIQVGTKGKEEEREEETAREREREGGGVMWVWVCARVETWDGD